MEAPKVCEDLVRERKKCSFDIEELTHIIDGGAHETEDRRRVEELVCSIPELRDPVPEEYMSHKEKFENAIRKAVLLTKTLRNNGVDGSDTLRPTNKYRITFGVMKDVSPFALHMWMFVPAIISQSDDEQREQWLPKAMTMDIIGTYAQTELGHGTFIRGLETTATYDPDTEEFVLHSPTLTSYKWWPGGLGHSVNHCIVVAQLYSKGKCYGVHLFFVQIRDTETHMPLPGIKVGDIGPKLGFSTANNGFLGFEYFRIPRRNMLMKHAQVLKNGSYIKSKNDKLTYGTMVFVRVITVTDLVYHLSMAATIAVRYSAVRHQSKIKAGEPEQQIMQYVTQQQKLFIAIATSHAIRITGQWLWKAYSNVMGGNMDLLPELHALTCCLKAVCSKDATACAQECRLACGGHGFMSNTSLPIINGIIGATVTYEGEYTVLMLQTARFLVKAWKMASAGKVMSPSVAHMVKFVNNDRAQWANTSAGIISGFQAVAAGKVKATCVSIQKYQDSGMDYDDAWNSASVQLVNTSEAHCRAILCQVSWQEMENLSKMVSTSLGKVLQQLAELYLVYWTLEKQGDLLLYSTIKREDLTQLQTRYEELLALIRPNAVGLVDAFDIRDEILNSTLGAYDGRVYERLMEEALKSPLNAEPVNRSFHQYLKPFMQGKL